MTESSLLCTLKASDRRSMWWCMVANVGYVDLFNSNSKVFSTFGLCVWFSGWELKFVTDLCEPRIDSYVVLSSHQIQGTPHVVISALCTTHSQQLCEEERVFGELIWLCVRWMIALQRTGVVLEVGKVPWGGVNMVLSGRRKRCWNQALSIFVTFELLLDGLEYLVVQSSSQGCQINNFESNFESSSLTGLNYIYVNNIKFAHCSRSKWRNRFEQI